MANHFLKILLISVLCITAFSAEKEEQGVDAKEIESEEICDRLTPKEVKEAFFSKKMEHQIKIIQEAADHAFDGFSKIKEKLPESMDNPIAKLFQFDIDSSEEDPKDRITDEIRMMLLGHNRGWNKIIQMQEDILNSGPESKVEATLTDLRTEINELVEGYRISQESIETALTTSMKQVAGVMKPLVVILEQIVKVGSDKMGENYLQEMVQNRLGKVLLNLVDIKTGKMEVEKPAVIEDCITMAEFISSHFSAIGRRVSLPEFWKSVLLHLSQKGYHKTSEEVDKEIIKLLTYYLSKTII